MLSWLPWKPPGCQMSTRAKNKVQTFPDTIQPRNALDKKCTQITPVNVLIRRNGMYLIATTFLIENNAPPLGFRPCRPFYIVNWLMHANYVYTVLFRWALIVYMFTKICKHDGHVQYIPLLQRTPNYHVQTGNRSHCMPTNHPGNPLLW